MIEAEKANYKINWMCRMLQVPRSSYYAWVNRIETPTQARRRELASQVERVFAAHHRRFGCRRIAAPLNREGHDCSVGLVADLMRELGLKAVQPRAYKRTTIPGEEPVSTPDLIDRDFDPASSVPGERLVGDITYLHTGQGWLYLNEMYHLHTWPTRARARFAVVEYIEVYYNRRRLHSGLGYRTPAEALSDHQTATQAA